MRQLLIALALFACLPLLWKPLWGQGLSVGIETGGKQKNVPADRPAKTATGERETKDAPPVVDIPEHEDAEEKFREKKEKLSIDAWTLRWAGITAGATVILMLVGIGGVIAAIRTLGAIEKQAALMETQIMDSRKYSESNTRDVQASIAEAVRSAKAMEEVAESTAVNAESVKESIRISREIADMQKLATVLHSRAYLSVFFNTAVFQDAHNIFEVKAVLKNHGNTPAYDVTFRAVSQLVSIPIPEDFAFPLPDTAAGKSVSLMAPGTTKLINRCVSGRVPDDLVETIKRGGPPQCLAMWGVVNYRDAFNESRYIRFAFWINWIPWLRGQEPTDKDGNPLPPQIISYDTAGHNDAN